LHDHHFVLPYRVSSRSANDEGLPVVQVLKETRGYELLISRHHDLLQMQSMYLSFTNERSIYGINAAICAHPWHCRTAAQGLSVVSVFAAAVEAVLHQHKVGILQQPHGRPCKRLSTAANGPH
jgi:hypothetical protein